MRLVDCQSHLFAPEYAALLERNRGAVSAQRDGDAYLVRFGAAQSLRMRPADYAPEQKLSDMDAAGVAVSILSTNIPGPELLEPALRTPAARLLNDYAAAVCRAHPDRFVGLASLPFGDAAEMMAEYARAVEQLDLRGVVLYSHINGVQVDDRAFEPLYAAAARDGIPLVFHPTVPTWADAISDYAMIPMMGFMVDHSFAMLRLILGGVLERHPRLTVVHPHCGGVLPYLMPRVDEQTEIKRRGRDHITQAPSAYYRNVYVDIVSPSARTARFALETSGAERLLFASDHPWIEIGAMVAVFEGMGLDARQRELIGWENASALFRIGT